MLPKAEDFKVNTLMAVLRSMNLSVEGTKADLIARLNNADATGKWIVLAQVMAMTDLHQCLSKISINEDSNIETGGKTTNQDDDEYSESDSDSDSCSDSTAVLEDDNDGLEKLKLNPEDPKIRDADNLERELQAAKAEIERLRSAANSNFLQDPKKSEKDENIPKIQFGLNNIQGLLNKFDGNRENFHTWINQVRLLKENYKLNDRETTILIVSRLKGKAYRWFHSKSEHVNMNMEELINEMTKMYGRPENILERRKNFERRKWKRSETFREYYHDKKILATKVPIDQSEILSYVIAGIPNENIKNQLLLQKLTTEKEILDAMEDIKLPQVFNQNMKKNEKFNQTKNIASGAAQSDDTEQSKGAIKKKFESKERPPPHCFNCNASGHMAYECKEPKRKKGSCFKCGSMDHKISDCKEKTNKNQGDSKALQKSSKSANEATPLIERTITVIVVKAQLVTNYGLTRMDPYVKLRVGDLVMFSEVNYNGATSPEWNQELSWSESSPPPGITDFYLEIWDKNSFSPDSIIAWADIKIPSALIKKTQKRAAGWYPLSGQGGDDKEGEIYLKFHYSEKEKKKWKKRNNQQRT